MKQQTGLQKLSKQFFEELVKYNLESFENYFKIIEEKWFNVKQFNSESAILHTDYFVWEQLYWSVCAELVEIRKFYEPITEK